MNFVVYSRSLSWCILLFIFFIWSSIQIFFWKDIYLSDILCVFHLLTFPQRPVHSSIRQLWCVWPSLRLHWLSIKQITTTWVIDVLFLFIVFVLLWNFIGKFLTMIFVKFTFLRSYLWSLCEPFVWPLALLQFLVQHLCKVQWAYYDPYIRFIVSAPLLTLEMSPGTKGKLQAWCYIWYCAKIQSHHSFLHILPGAEIFLNMCKYTSTVWSFEFPLSVLCLNGSQDTLVSGLTK